MKKIGLFSDTHSYIDDDIKKYFDKCDEIWHAGDIGNDEVLDYMRDYKPSRIVFGNIDSNEMRNKTDEDLIFTVEGLKVAMTHIAGYPKRYTKRARKILVEHKPDLFICGHSHICKVMRDHEYDHLHMNPGAFGHHGFHKIRTMLRFDIEDGKIINLEAIELGQRGYIEK